MDLKINESKVLEFKAVIEGGDADDLSGKLRININNVEYGFPATSDGKKINVTIPALKDYIREDKLRSAKSADIRLDIVAKGKLFTPWKDTINLEIPLEVKAEMTDIKGFLEEADNIIKVSKVEEKVEVKVEPEEEEKTKTLGVDETPKKKSKFSIMLEEKEKKGDE